MADSELVFRYAERSESEQGPAIRDFITGFLAEVGIGTEVSVFDDTQLTDVIASGEYDLFSWGWTPFVDPDPMLSYFTCDQVTTDIESVGYNDANWCDRASTTSSTSSRRSSSTATSGSTSCTRCCGCSTTSRRTSCCTRTPTPRRTAPTGSRAGCSQPAEIGPVLFTNSSPSYFNLTPIEGGGGDGGGLSTGVLIAIIAAGIIVIGGGVLLVVRNRTSRDDRE